MRTSERRLTGKDKAKKVKAIRDRKQNETNNRKKHRNPEETETNRKRQ